MWNQAKNNNSNDRNVNTKIKTFFGDLSCLQLDYWNDNISIKINPLQGVNADGIRTYDYNRRANTALSTEKCLVLAKKIDELIMPKIKEVKEKGSLDNPVSTGVQVGTKGTAVCIEYKNHTDDKPYVFLTVYTNIGSDNKTSKDNTFTYKFAKVATVDNYDAENGTGVDDSVDAEFLFFYNKIKNIADVSGTAAHSVNTDSAYKTTGNKSNNSFNSSQNNGYSAPPTSSNYSAPMSQFSEEGFAFS